MNRSGEIEVSVIVAFHNAERYFGELLDSLLLQTDAGSWELILVDNGSTDCSRRIAERFSSRLPITFVDAPEQTSASYARNAGVRVSRGPKLLFIDADDTVNASYIAAMARALDRAALVTSRVDSITLNAEWVRSAHGLPWQADEVGVFFNFLRAAGSNIGVHRSLFDSLGGFMNDYVSCEDIAFSWHARLKSQVDVGFVRDALYRYRYRDTLSGLFRQSVGWGTASVFLFHEFREHGMPGRSLRMSIEEWRGVLTGLVRATTRAARAPLIVRLGYCVGRLIGSCRYRVSFF
jgi:glycosyltransferase involved in cell wall biosynthesis